MALVLQKNSPPPAVPLQGRFFTIQKLSASKRQVLKAKQVEIRASSFLPIEPFPHRTLSPSDSLPLFLCHIFIPADGSLPHFSYFKIPNSSPVPIYLQAEGRLGDWPYYQYKVKL